MENEHLITSDEDTEDQTNTSKQSPYVHPFIQMINSGFSEAEMISVLDSFCGRSKVCDDDNGNPIYDVVDQTEYIAPMLQVFSYCASRGQKNVISWICNNFVPLQVSYDNNFCYFECLTWNHLEIADIIATHESFEPTVHVLINMLERGRYLLFQTCMMNPNLEENIRVYRFTLMHYIDNNQYQAAFKLVTQLKNGLSNVDIEDPIMSESDYLSFRNSIPCPDNATNPEGSCPENN